jgi:4-alpha-glucanotransferase
LTPEQLREGLATLGVKRLLLAIHDVSFPSDPDEDIGRGSPATKAAQRLFAYARGLGFTGVQLGPQGQTSRSNPSPYDGTIFSRHIGNIALATLRELIGDAAVEQCLVEGGHARHGHAYDAIHDLVRQAYERVGQRDDIRIRLDAFRREQASWLESDAAFAARRESEATRERAIEQYVFGQMLVHEEHQRVRRTCGLKLYGDMQIGYAEADVWRFAGVFLHGYLMGAPPSRTNPEGQPWGYPVLDPAQYDGAARDLVVARSQKAFAEYDSIRIDHPHGLICPWVYRSDAGPHAVAVREGARLFESPDLDDHPRLAPFSIARADQIDRGKSRYHDAWVTDLDEDQVARYAILFDAILDAAQRAGRSRDDISCEVLSTMPAPLGAVMKRHGLGRWRVTQKANMDDPTDVYRTENAQREDWVMLGNHDTAPIMTVIRDWQPAQREKWARHLAARLKLLRPQRLASAGFMASAMLAELFVSRAENVSIFFADLFGYTERFNVPGLVDDANWSLRLPHDFEGLHAERLAREEAIDLPLAVELALAATPGRN